jgi:Holliday junction resolvase
VPRSPYRKGARYEYYVKRLLEEKGYLVFRTAGSHGPFDLIAFDVQNKVILLVQVKKSKYIPNKEKEALKTLAGTYTIKPVFYTLGEWLEL